MLLPVWLLVGWRDQVPRGGGGLMGLLGCGLGGSPLVCRIGNSPLKYRLDWGPLGCRIGGSPLGCWLGSSPLVCWLSGFGKGGLARVGDRTKLLLVLQVNTHRCKITLT
jgi:hypothetical protein